jgi:NAD(P)-dependent dehydrogenase (short-subunit alcohol dehydrogenase family)
MIFKNKIFVIIGGEGLIGKAFKQHVLINGGKICSVDILKKPSSLKKNEIYIKANISNLKNIQKILTKTQKKFKKIDCVINCSYPKNNQSKNLKSIKFNDLKKNIAEHLGSTIILCKSALDFFKKQGYGNIILLSSIQGIMSPKFEHYKNTNMYSPIEYTANKHAIIGIVKYFAKLYGKYNININSISPGGIKNNQDKKFLKKYRSSCLRKGMLNTTDLISTMEYLSDERSNIINGQNLIVDDGWSL